MRIIPHLNAETVIDVVEAVLFEWNMNTAQCEIERIIYI